MLWDGRSGVHTLGSHLQLMIYGSFWMCPVTKENICFTDVFVLTHYLKFWGCHVAQLEYGQVWEPPTLQQESVPDSHVTNSQSCQEIGMSITLSLFEMDWGWISSQEDVELPLLFGNCIQKMFPVRFSVNIRGSSESNGTFEYQAVLPFTKCDERHKEASGNDKQWSPN